MSTFQTQLAAFESLGGVTPASLTGEQYGDILNSVPTGKSTLGTQPGSPGDSITGKVAGAVLNFAIGPLLAIVLGLVCIAGAIYLSKDSDAVQGASKHIAKLGALKTAAEVAA